MAAIKSTLKDGANDLYPVTRSDCVYDSNGTQLTSTLQSYNTKINTHTSQIQNLNSSMQDLIKNSEGSALRLAYISVTDWTDDNTVNVSVLDVTDTNVVMISSYDDSSEYYCLMHGIRCISQSTDSLTFSCTTKPSYDVALNVLIINPKNT